MDQYLEKTLTLIGNLDLQRCTLFTIGNPRCNKIGLVLGTSYAFVFRVTVLIDIPTLNLNAKTFQENDKTKIKLVNKCFLILSLAPEGEEEEESFEKIVSALIDHIKEFPKIIMVLTDDDTKETESIFQKFKSPIILFNPRSSIFTLHCIMRDNSVRSMWKLVEEHGMHKMCPQQKEIMRIGYNKVPPFFEFETEEPDNDTLESIIITTFLESHKLDAIWMWTKNIWGSKGPDGRFNGVVGKVAIKSHVAIC